MIQNPKWTLVIEVPNAEVGKAASGLYSEAIKKSMAQCGTIRPMPDITVNLVPAGSTNPQKFDAGPVSEVAPSGPSIKQ